MGGGGATVGYILCLVGQGNFILIREKSCGNHALEGSTWIPVPG